MINLYFESTDEIKKIDSDTLDGYDFSGELLHTAIFEGLSLQHASFEQANLRSANFAYCILHIK
ncbi:pentapeptide repeat-containing protein [Providencia stuartii]|uniref:pentapeptide repeat-containing protein n=1 Tax=Providencia stuartii TaxID=588 RepID=UPI00370B051F